MGSFKGPFYRSFKGSFVGDTYPNHHIKSYDRNPTFYFVGAYELSPKFTLSSGNSLQGIKEDPLNFGQLASWADDDQECAEPSPTGRADNPSSREPLCHKDP